MKNSTTEPGAVQEDASASRRRFLQDLAMVATVAATAEVLEQIGLAPSAGAYEATSPERPADTTPPLASPAPTPDSEPRNILLRMQDELRRALKKPVEQRRWVMGIDLQKCIGCSACTLACNAENNLPPGVVYRPVIDEEIGEYPHVRRRFIPRPCLQCDNPPCVPVCPTKATYKRPDGIVEINYDQCIGCRYCLTACPYSARTADFGDTYSKGTPSMQPYEKRPSFEYGRKRVREKGKSPIGNARKCHFCLHRLEAGMLPACVTTCVGYATYFGDANDPDSLVSELMASPRIMRLKEELGTKPKVFYLV
jgi:molybdopterin-containing oxidoreductase family iron-sulfur binding subunit